MKSVVFDTNVYISALHFHSGPPRKILELADRGVLRLVISKQILSELRGVLRSKFQYDSERLDLLERLLVDICVIVDPKRRIHRIKADPDDDKILECAIEGEVDYIISGDSHLLKIKTYKHIRILSSAEFFAILKI